MPVAFSSQLWKSGKLRPGGVSREARHSSAGHRAAGNADPRHWRRGRGGLGGGAVEGSPCSEAAARCAAAERGGEIGFLESGGRPESDAARRPLAAGPRNNDGVPARGDLPCPRDLGLARGCCRRRPSFCTETGGGPATAAQRRCSARCRLLCTAGRCWTACGESELDAGNPAGDGPGVPQTSRLQRRRRGGVLLSSLRARSAV